MKLYSLIAYVKYVTIFNTLRIVNCLTCSEGYVYYNNSNSCIECGLTFNTPNVKIVGGVPANPNSWPAQALIIQTYKGYHSIGGVNSLVSVQYQCGGTLINSFTILTAAHCINEIFDNNGTSYYMNFVDNSFYKSLESTFTIYLGLNNASFLNNVGQTPSPPAVTYYLSKTIIYPYYDDSTTLNDIALFILKNEVIFNSFIQPACIPTLSVTYPTPNRTSYAAGWGTLTSGGSTPDLLYNVNLTIYNMSLCSNVYPNVSKNQNSQICAGEYSGGKDPCQGDTGGALYILDTFGGKQRYMVTGIVSYGDGCARAGYPGIYTRVSYYTNWIKSNWVEYSIGTTTITSTTTTSSYTTTAGLSNSSIIAIAVVVPLVILIVGAVIGFIIFKVKNKFRINPSSFYEPEPEYKPVKSTFPPINQSQRTHLYDLPEISNKIQSTDESQSNIDYTPGVPAADNAETNPQEVLKKPENNDDEDYDYQTVIQPRQPETQNISDIPKKKRSNSDFDDNINENKRHQQTGEISNLKPLKENGKISDNENKGSVEVITPKPKSHKKKINREQQNDGNQDNIIDGQTEEVVTKKKSRKKKKNREQQNEENTKADNEIIDDQKVKEVTRNKSRRKKKKNTDDTVENDVRYDQNNEYWLDEDLKKKPSKELKDNSKSFDATEN